MFLLSIYELLSSFVNLLWRFRSSKLFKCNTFVVVDKGIVRVELKGLLIGDKGLLVTLKVAESIAHVKEGKSIIWIELKGLFIGDKGLLVTLKVAENITSVEVGKLSFVICLLGKTLKYLPFVMIDVS